MRYYVRQWKNILTVGLEACPYPRTILVIFTATKRRSRSPDEITTISITGTESGDGGVAVVELFGDVVADATENGNLSAVDKRIPSMLIRKRNFRFFL
jgi:hypothetical protein